MKLSVKVAALLLIVALSACKKNEEIKPDTETATQTTSTETTGVETHRSPMDICCSAEDLDDPESLLSKRVIYFDFDQATVRPEYRDIVAIHARYLSQNPEAHITLEGHADERGSREYNLGLGERRAKSVANLMKAQGASSSQIDIVSYGEERPVCTESNEACWSKNRRVEIVYNHK